MKKFILLLLINCSMNCLVVAQNAVYTNVALGKEAKQSSTSEWSNPNDAQGAVNGIKNGSYGFHTYDQVNPWWQVDLEIDMVIEKVIVFNRQDCCAERARTLQVLISKDGYNFQNVYTHDGTVFGGVNQGQPLIIPMNYKGARFVRLQLNEKNALHLDEVEVYGAPLQNENLALGKPASQSSRSQWSKPNDAQGAVDGIKNGSYGFHTNEQVNPWWQVDLGANAVIEKILVFNRQDCCADRAQTAQVLISKDGVAYENVANLSNTVFGGVRDDQPLTIYIDEMEHVARYIRIELRESTALHLDEVEVYGRMLPSVAPAIEMANSGPGITFYEHANFVGASITTNTYWDYSMNQGWNDRISSIRIPAGYKIQVFANGDQKGPSMVLTSDWTVTASNAPFNDVISAITILEYPSTVAPVSIPVQIVEPVVVTIAEPVVAVSNCNLNDAQFQKVESAIKSKPFRDTKMSTAKVALKNKCLSISQIRVLAKLFPFEDDRMEFVKFTYDLADNKDEFYTLSDVFVFDSYQAELNEFISSKN